MFGFIKNLFGGIFGFLGRLLGLKKSEYFLDLDPSPANGSVKPEPAKAQKSEPAKAQKSEPAKAQSLVAVAAPAKVEPAPSAKKSESASAKKEKAAKKPSKENEPAPKPAVVSNNGKVPTQAAPVMTFAPNYLMPTPTANRRLPGPSMSNFRDMARQMKTTK